MPFDPTNYEGRDRLSHVEDYLSSNKSDAINRFTGRWVNRAILGETLELSSFTPGNSLASQGNAIATLYHARAGDIISNITLYNVSNAGSNAFFKIGIWSTAGVLRASTSAKPSTAFSTANASYITSALSTQYQPTADTFVYVGIAASVAAGPRVLAAPTPALNMYAKQGIGNCLGVTASLATSDALSVTWLPATVGAPYAALT